MNRRPARWVFVGIQIVGSASSIASFLRGLQLLVIDISNWTALVWLATFVLLATVAIGAHQKASPLLGQSGTEHGHWRTSKTQIFYPVPYKSVPHLRLSKLHLKVGFFDSLSTTVMGNRQVIAIEQRKDGFTAQIRSGYSDEPCNWSFKWKAKGIPEIIG